jgi:hypothetical protein
MCTISDHQQFLSDRKQFLSDRQQILSDRQQFFTDRHPHDNRAGLRFTLRHHDSEWKQFSPPSIAWFSSFSRFPMHGRTFRTFLQDAYLTMGL